MEPVAVNSKVKSLQEVPAENLPTMLCQMRNRFPETIHAHEFVRMLIRYKKINPDLQISFLAPRGDYKLGIIFFMVDENSFFGSVYCENEQASKAMEVALNPITLNLPLKRFTLFTGMGTHARRAMKPFIDKKKWHELGGLMYWMPWYTARELEVDLPDGVKMRKLCPKKHAGLITFALRPTVPGIEEMIRKQITYNFGLGIFRDDELISWAIHFFYGGIGAVQTRETERRKGYGKTVVLAITKKLGEMQSDVHLNVVQENEDAEEFFRSLGFRFAFHNHWTGNNII